ncbi:MAG: hypothetical protein LWX09_12720, partial [Bacteroidia bacterium]|nr:hypothetical protein [Bacteroidia bacterium]
MAKKNKNIRFPATGMRWLLGMMAFAAALAVKAQPAWTPPGNMQYNMQVVGRLQLSGGNFSTNGNDMVAAFVGGELRGVASPLSSAEGRIFLSILSNQVSGETVSFKAWISSSAQIVDLNETLAFTSQGEAGTYNNPFIFTIVQGPVSFTIQASAGTGGSISPSGTVTVPQGGSQTFSISPSAGYQIQDVLVNGQSVGAVSSYTFTNVQSNQSIHATFSQITYTITATAGAGGSINPSGAVSVPHGGSQSFSISPNQGYSIQDVLVDGQSVGPVSGYTFQQVTGNRSIHALFAAQQYTLTYLAGQGGSISGNAVQTVPHGGSGSPVTAVPSSGYSFVQWSDGRTDNPRQEVNVTANITVTANFTSLNVPPGWQPPVNMQYNMQVVARLQHPGGTYSTNSADVVAAFVGSEVRGMALPLQGQDGRIFLTISSNEAQGESVTFKAWLSSTAQVVNLNENLSFTNQAQVGNWLQPFILTYNVNSPPPQFSITATAGTGGSISPSGVVNVTQGANQTFTITPNAGYLIADVLVNGQSVGALSSYTFTNVQGNQSIHATFTQITFTITATAGAGGSISPSGAVVVPQGGSQTFSIIPNAGYFIADVLVNGQSVGALSSYTFTNVQSNQSIHATFTQITYTISASAGAGGGISPSGAVVVPQGGSQTFTITPNAGYLIADVLVNGQSVGAVSSYTFTNVQGNQSIHAEFSEITYTISASAGAGGSISPSGAVVVPQGGNQTFTITPNTGYLISNVLVNGLSVGAVSSYTFTNVQSNQSIHATFTQITYTITATAGAGGS